MVFLLGCIQRRRLRRTSERLCRGLREVSQYRCTLTRDGSRALLEDYDRLKKRQSVMESSKHIASSVITTHRQNAKAFERMVQDAIDCAIRNELNMDHSMYDGGFRDMADKSIHDDADSPQGHPPPAHQDLADAYDGKVMRRTTRLPGPRHAGRVTELDMPHLRGFRKEALESPSKDSTTLVSCATTPSASPVRTMAGLLLVNDVQREDPTNRLGEALMDEDEVPTPLPLPKNALSAGSTESENLNSSAESLPLFPCRSTRPIPPPARPTRSLRRQSHGLSRHAICALVRENWERESITNPQSQQETRIIQPAKADVSPMITFTPVTPPLGPTKAPVRRRTRSLHDSPLDQISEEDSKSGYDSILSSTMNQPNTSLAHKTALIAREKMSEAKFNATVMRSQSLHAPAPARTRSVRRKPVPLS